MPLYMLSVHHVEGEEMPAPEDMQPIFEAVDAFNTRVQKEGIWVFGGGLEAPDVASVVDASKGGDALVTDGPFGEAKEHLGGFWILRAPDLDAALALATEASAACAGAVEVRPFQADTEG